MIDEYGRNIHYLRVSVTDSCNLRCRYCMPEEIEMYSKEEILRYDEISRLVHVMAGLGVDRVRLTGGEPLVRKDLPDLVTQIRKIEEIRFLGLTTNGVLLKEMAGDLYRAGVDGINISLDTTNPERYAEITRRDRYNDAIAGIEAALEQPFKTLKINCVLSPNVQEDDWLGVVTLAKRWPVDVRFIEWMPMSGEDIPMVIDFKTALETITKKFGFLHTMQSDIGSGPARYWHVKGFKGRIGFIPAMSRCFCESCNRVRLTSIGDLKLCLFYDMGISLKPMLRGGASNDEIAGAIRAALLKKPKKHQGSVLPYEGEEYEPQITHTCYMYKTGG